MDILAKAHDGEFNLGKDKETKDLKVDSKSLDNEQKMALEDEILV